MKTWKLLAVVCITAVLFGCGGGGGGGTSTGNNSGSSGGGTNTGNNGGNNSGGTPQTPPAAQVEITSFAPASAAYGETVTITGQNFSSVSTENSVTFNGVSAVVTSTTPTEIKVTVPKNTLCSGKLKVTVAGNTVTSASDFTYILTYSVTTLAGSGAAGTNGFADGTGAAAQFNYPIGVAVDTAGNVYVADSINARIRKITSTGVVSTIAGGAGAVVQLWEPTGVAVDATGNVYVADMGGCRIDKITPTGVVNTLAGSGTLGFADGAGATAMFLYPYSIAVDADGNVYVADMNNNRIRKITSAGVVSTIAGSGDLGFVNGTGTAAQFWNPTGVAVDAAGNVYVADKGNNCIRKITPAGVVSTFAGSGTMGFADGAGTAAQFNQPVGVAVDATGDVYVADTVNNCIRKITPAGVVSTLAGSGTPGFADGPLTVAQFSNPSGVAVDAAGNVYVADQINNCIRKITGE
ncbi:MAG: IPT/TIG domain-containing protein [Desulfuromonadales bacterium]|nr:IPT/TIG domain-containing protein [Desulfuromonadales bacterium]